MESCSVELHVAPGMAGDFDLSEVHYGLLVHWRVPSGTGTRETVEFWPFRSEKGEPIEHPGVSIDRLRVETERGHDTDLDHRLVRSSVFALEFAEGKPLGKPQLQQAYVLVKAKSGHVISENLAMSVHVSTGPPGPIQCRDEGPTPIRLWAKGQWNGTNALEGLQFLGNLAEYVAAIKKRLNDIVREWEEASRNRPSPQPTPSPRPVRRPTPAPAPRAGPRPAAAPARPAEPAYVLEQRQVPPREDPVVSLLRQASRWRAADTFRRASWFVWSVPPRRLFMATLLLTIGVFWIIYQNVVVEGSLQLDWDRAFLVSFACAAVVATCFKTMAFAARAEVRQALPHYDLSPTATRADLRQAAADAVGEASVPAFAHYAGKLRSLRIEFQGIAGGVHNDPHFLRARFPRTRALVGLAGVVLFGVLFCGPLYRVPLSTGVSSLALLPVVETPKPAPPETPRPPAPEIIKPRQPEASPTPPPSRPPALPAIVSGFVEELDQDGWPMIGGQVIHLVGVGWIAEEQRESFKKWFDEEGQLDCERRSTDVFRCVTSVSRIDVSEALLLNGGGAAAEGASDLYRAAMFQAQRKSVGLWSNGTTR